MDRRTVEESSPRRTVVPTDNASIAEPAEIRWLSALLSALALVFLGLGIVALLVHFVPYAKASAFLESHLSSRGSPGSVPIRLTEGVYNRFVGRLPIATCVFGLCGVILALFRRKLAGFLRDIPSEWIGIGNSLRRQFHGGTETLLEVSAVFIVFAIGVFLRLWHLGRPVRFDEAWTYVDFASRPLVLVLSRYPVPNNHLLNTLLVHCSTRLFGNTIFGLRAPAFVAGCLAILAAWLVGRVLYGSLAGILAAGCVAALPTFIEFSINARGYALQWLSILACMGFAAVLQENPSLKAAWLGLVVAAVAGIYAIPTTLLAVIGIFAWMLGPTVTDGNAAERKQLIRKVVLASVAIALPCMLLYLPPILVSGPAAVAAQSTVAFQRESTLAAGMEHMAQCARVYWTEGVPPAAIWILVGGLCTGLFFHHKLSKNRVPITIALFLVAAMFAWAHHVFGFPRVWSYLFLSAVITASAGISLVVRYLTGRSRIRQVALAAVISVTLSLFVATSLLHQGVLFTTNETGRIVDSDEIVNFLRTELRPGDSLVSNAMIEYEVLRRDPRLYASLSNPQDASRVLAVVVKHTGSTELCNTEEQVARMAAQDTADPATLAERIDLSEYKRPELRAKFLTSTVYSLKRMKSTQ
jgi:hypothetical protein